MTHISILNIPKTGNIGEKFMKEERMANQKKKKFHLISNPHPFI